MSNTRVAVLVAMALVVAAAVWTKVPIGSNPGSVTGPVPSPPSSPTAAVPPAATPAPTPTPAPSAAPTVSADAPPAAPAAPAPAASTATPAAPSAPAAEAPTAIQTPAAPAAEAPTPAAPNVQATDQFGEQQILTARKVVILKGSATWDNAFETLVGSLKTLSGFLDKQGIKPAGSSLIVYTSTDDAGFTYQAEIPVDQDPKNLARGMSIGTSPEGPTLKFVHRGSYDNMDNTYEAITNHLDEKKQEAKDTFIEEYVTDPLTTTEDKLVINVFVPLK
ncbi:MAG: GyrI-like domain-containing protein [Afipia sp.]|nr:GyrI-like domain-containing protein [Afipia sp.]